MKKNLKIALVHDYLLDWGGAELVLYELHKMFPKAPIYVSLVNKKGMGNFWKRFENADIKKSWFHYLPFSSRLISPLRFLLPVIWNSFDFKNYDLVITSASWAVTKGMKSAKKEICYLHTPPRYLYGYETSRNIKNKWYGWVIKIYSAVVNHFMRLYDFKAAQKVDFFIANSKNVGQRIEKFYRRKYKVIYPPIEVEKILKSKTKPHQGKYFLAGGRLVASKNFDLIIKACQKLKIKLIIFGTGVEENRLKKLSNSNIEFLGRVSNEKLISLYKGAEAFILAERQGDFGITPIEAAAAGCPSIAFRGGGYLETIIDNKTGIFFKDLTVESITKAIKTFKTNSWDKKIMQKHARSFSTKRFEKEMLQFIRKNA